MTEIIVDNIRITIDGSRVSAYLGNDGQTFVLSAVNDLEVWAWVAAMRTGNWDALWTFLDIDMDDVDDVDLIPEEEHLDWVWIEDPVLDKWEAYA